MIDPVIFASEPIYVDIEIEDETIDVDVDSKIEIISADYPFYEGAYNARPSFETQELETQNTILTQNVEVEPIYVSRTSNLAGGITVFIGGNTNA